MSDVPVNDEERPVSPEDEDRVGRPVESHATVPVDAPEADFLEQQVEEPVEPESGQD